MLALALLLSGCAGLPSHDLRERPEVRRAFQEDQTRRAHIGYWKTEGVLRLQEQEFSRALRITLKGFGRQTARMRVFGPFRQMEMEILSHGDRLEMIHPSRREVWRVPATAEAMARVVGIPFPPAALMEILLGLGDLSGRILDAPLPPGGDSRQGVARVVPGDGRLLERRAWLPGVGAVRVTYAWPDGTPPASDLPPMPEEVRVEMEEPAVNGLRSLEMNLREWRFPADAEEDPLLSREVPPGFQVVETL